MADDLSYDEIIAILEKANEEERERERRKKADWVTAMPVILGSISTLLVFFAWVIWDWANPVRTGTDWVWLTFFNYTPQEVSPWPRVPVNITFIMILVSLALCIFGYIFNKRRLRRKRDKRRLVVYISGILAILTLVAFLIKFIPMGIIGRW